jgi:glycosyltransferase involved in cell wall biosynthesis/SAM-dependent methyltransferase
MPFCCRVCGKTTYDRRLTRGDGQDVLFCEACDMGLVEQQPASTVHFYGDGYYGGLAGLPAGSHYEDYDFTAEHTLLWVRLMVEALRPTGGRILDVGCANGFLLNRLNGHFERFGIEVNTTAATAAARSGITIIASDIADPRVMSHERFDVVTAMATLEHVLDIRGAVAICLDLLAPGGSFLYEVPLISEFADNKDWLNASYEHISYPTRRGLEALFASFPGTLHTGFETEIRGFSASYIGVAARDPSAFARAERLLGAMAQPHLTDLDLTERRLNLAYHLVHGFRPTPDRVLALPELFEVASSPNLLKRLTQLWYNDCVLAQSVKRASLSNMSISRPTTKASSAQLAISCRNGDQFWPGGHMKGATARVEDLKHFRSAPIVALLPFLVHGALSIAVLRALRAQGADVAVAYCLANSGGYTHDPMADFATENRLIDLSGLPSEQLRDRLQREFADRHVRLVLQIGAFSLYPVLPYLKQYDPSLRLVDIQYNEVGHTVNHFLYEACFDGLIVESHHMARFVRDNTAKPDPHVRVVESGIDLDFFAPAKPQSDQDRLCIGFIGRLSPEKNPLGFISLFESLAERLPNLSASIAGEGPIAEDVRLRIASSPAAHKLNYLGRVESVAEALRAVDVLIVPSTLDGRPLIVMEANASGVPVIGAPVGGIPELIEEGVNGYLARPWETDRIASVLRGWANDPARLAAIRVSSRKIAEARFDRRRMIADYGAAFAHFLLS